ncbi:NgoMIV family type II restriction endonuclease [Microbacterium phyllosphaerae]|uniref:NgoMIV family type II restriction endonuclease n=1 Tax=Microbacterium phyllosphaerae TaxID=124798 RepID=UPI000EA2BA07|nr:NgoMIV family type II restriction endonuclease [Microbacterium phyllosphaerae]
MPASFAVALCGFRDSGAPNTSDNNDPQSKELGLELFRQMMVPDGKPGASDPGSALEAAVLADLSSRRPDLLIERSRSVANFAQYRHLAVFPAFRKTYKPVSEAMAALGAIASALPKSREASKLQAALRRTSTRFAAQDALTSRMVGEMPEEAILKVDLTVGQPRGAGDPHMEIGVSAKWSLRTDRAQDCISQGARLASQRRGAMPHFAVLTMEPRPAMLRILADGSGAIDCVYHFDLPALTRAIDVVASRKKGSWSPKRTFDRLVLQGRIRDYSELVESVERIPAGR